MLDQRWRKSSRSGTNGACVEVRRVDALVQVRDSKDRQGPVLSFPPQVWHAFVTGVHSGDFDRR